MASKASESILSAKREVIDDIKAKIQGAQSIVLMSYQGLTAAQDTELRAKLREAGVEYKVLKNRLVRIALNELGYTEFDKDLEGPTAVAFGHADAVAPAKILCEYTAKFGKIAVKSGMVDHVAIDANGVKELAELPSKEVLVAKVLGMLQAPITGFVRVLNGTIGGLAIALKAIADKQEA